MRPNQCLITGVHIKSLAFSSHSPSPALTRNGEKTRCIVFARLQVIFSRSVPGPRPNPHLNNTGNSVYMNLSHMEINLGPGSALVACVAGVERGRGRG